MKATILIDNQAAADTRLQHEHGLSIYFEADGKRILLDTGLSGKALSNAQLLGIDVGEIDWLILSHGHVDHTGGLEAFLQQNEKASIYASRHILTWNYSSNHHGNQHSLSPNEMLIHRNLQRFHLLDNHVQLSPQLWLVFNRCHDFPAPNGNQYLSLIDAQGSCIPYGAEDEISVAIVENQHLHILASCSHNGILNIIRSCQKVTGISDIATYIGGLHLLDDSESENSLQTLASEILKQYPNLSLHTGHCTGTHAKNVLQKALKKQFHTFCTGEMIE